MQTGLFVYQDEAMNFATGAQGLTSESSYRIKLFLIFGKASFIRSVENTVMSFETNNVILVTNSLPSTEKNSEPD